MNIIKPSKPQFEPSRDELALTKTEPFFDLLKSIIEESTEEAKKTEEIGKALFLLQHLRFFWF